MVPFTLKNTGENFDELLGSQIIAADGTFLGIVSKDKYASDSISNPFGDYGDKFSPISILNRFGNYGSKFSSQSPFNRHTSSPPHLVKDHEIIGYLTLNQHMDGAIDTNEFFRWLETE